ncbi:UDP-N-acetylmuramoyl-L-alanine--D-glutamate ligase [Candidatus Uhrbacteria bacterium]|nr:UDP-N-acetylmuramoyl-L-alanine--D-glutamate ligase [Candidatus Uhrbacteria bacterium]
MLTNFQNKRVTVMGLGLYEKGTGIEAVKFFLRQGSKVTVTDLRSARELEGSVRELVKYWTGLRHRAKGIERRAKNSKPLALSPKLAFVFGKHREEDFKNADVVFQNPSVPSESPYLRIAAKRKIPVVNDWSLFLARHTPKLFIGVTGTRGKSTTTALIYEMLKYHHSPFRPNRRMGKVWLAGNLGASPLSFIDTYNGEPIVAELSSWLLHHFPTVKKSPNIAVVTNIMNDHLDKYRNIREYIADKENIFRFQKRGDTLVLNYDNAATRAMAKRARGKVVWFSAEKQLPRWVPLEDLQIPGAHNRANALAAAVAADAAGVTRRDIAHVLKTFRGLPNRLELVRTVDGVRYYNDTTATTPEATVAALATLGQRQITNHKSQITKNIVLIAGGADKKLEFRELAKYVKQYCKAVVLLPGTATNKFKPLITNYQLPITLVKQMKEAVKKAHVLAQSGDIVLLSPAAASFGLFKNEFDRGRQFVDHVRKLV